MIILNSFLNNYFNKNKINNNHKISFQANINKISKEIMLKKSDYEKISELAILHQNISDACALLRKKLKTAIKQSYPGLISNKKRKGFIFDSLSKDKSTLIQMVKYNIAKEKDELITLNILDKALEPLFSFRFDKAGKVLITSDILSTGVPDGETYLLLWLSVIGLFNCQDCRQHCSQLKSLAVAQCC